MGGAHSTSFVIDEEFCHAPFAAPATPRRFPETPAKARFGQLKRERMDWCSTPSQHSFGP
jgi:hypothetical protein